MIVQYLFYLEPVSPCLELSCTYSEIAEALLSSDPKIKESCDFVPSLSKSKIRTVNSRYSSVQLVVRLKEIGSVDGTGPRTLRGYEISKPAFSKNLICLTTRTVPALNVDFSSLIKSKVEYNESAIYKESSNQRI